MSIHNTIKSSFEKSKRSSIFTSNSHDKRNLWWKAFRKTVLEPHAIAVLENPMTDKVPEKLLSLVEDKCQSLERHEQKALAFIEAVSQGRGFGVSPIFPSDIVPALRSSYVARSLEPSFDGTALPMQEDSLRVPIFDLPVPRPGLASGFSKLGFTEEQFKEIPASLTSVGTYTDHSSGKIEHGHAIYGSYLLFERTYGHAKHEIECAMNYCAMNGAAALNSISKLYDAAWPGVSKRPTRNPVVFSCIVDNDVGIINHHWMSEGGFFVAPLCKFDFRDVEHFMHFLAWIEAIEEWATGFFLPDLQKALQVLADITTLGYSAAKALPSPVSDIEKQEMLSRSMRLAFENMPWKGERSRKTPLGVTGAMRMRSPKVTAEPSPVVSPMKLSHTIEPVQPKPSETETADKAPTPEKVKPDALEATTSVPTEITKPDTAQTRNVTNLSFNDTSPPTNVKTNLPPVPSSASVVDTITKQKSHNPGLSLVRSAGLMKGVDPPKDEKTFTSPGFETSRSNTPVAYTVPLPQTGSGKSPAVFTPSAAMKSPAQSIASIQSKRSFTSLRRDKRLKSPHTPDSTFSATSPRAPTFKSKISSGLGMIREHAISKRSRADNSAPPSAKESAALPTPAYDKKRFDIKTPRPQLPEAPVSVTESPALRPVTSPQPARQEIKPVDISSDQEKVKSVEVSSGPGTTKSIGVVNYSTQDDYHARHDLPLRQWAKSPTSAVTTTTMVTALSP